MAIAKSPASGAARTRTVRWLLLAVLLVLVAAFFAFDLRRFLDLAWLQARHDELRALVSARPGATAAGFFALYVAVTALSLPGAAIMTLAGGALFGLLGGTLLISFASTLGATAAFLSARFLLRDALRRRFDERLAAIDRGIDRDGAFYLFTLRLVPIFPFFLINLLMGLTGIRTRTYWWVSQLGMLPGTLVYVNAGRELARIDSAADILSPGLLLAFGLLGLFPLIARKSVEATKNRRRLRGYRKPRRFERNLVVIGAGSGGLVASYIAAALKAKVTLIEKHRLGGDCLNTGCVPSKALIRSARFVHEASRAAEFGARRAEIEFDFAEIMQRVQRVIARIEPHDSPERYRGLGVEVIQGQARIRSPYEVEVDGRILSTRAIVVAAGARPFVPPIPGLAEAGYLTSDTVWSVRERPERLLILGGGPIGCELAQAFARLGCRVSLVERCEQLLPREDADIAARVLERLRADGIDAHPGHTVRSVATDERGQRLLCEHAGASVEIVGDRILVAAGRVANVEGYGLEELGVRLNEQGTLAVNGFMQTSVPNIYACGDVAGPFQLTHAAAHQAWYAAVNALFGSPLKRFKADYSLLPTTIFVDPELARVGLNESEAKTRGIAYELTTFDLNELDRAIADGAADGLVKVLTVPGKDRILGVTILGAHAGELIGEFVLAMKHGLGLNKILATVHAYPTWGEANKYAAGAWRRAHTPRRLLAWVERLHAWRRG